MLLKDDLLSKATNPLRLLQETDSSFFKKIYNELEKDCLKLFYYYFFNILRTSIFCETATLFENLKSFRKNDFVTSLCSFRFSQNLLKSS